MKELAYALLLVLISFASMAQKLEQKLQRQIEQEIKGFRGEIGVYVKHLKSGKEVRIQADTVFPTASLVKVPLLVGIFHQIHDGKYSLDQEFIYDAKRVYGGSGLMQFYKDSAKTDLSTMISLMLTYSDNVTSLWIQELAGGGIQVNQLMDHYGLKDTKVNSRTEGRAKIWEKYGWGQTTPKEMSTLFTLIREGKIINKEQSVKMYRYLKNQYYNERSLSSLPPTVNTISKTGSVNQARGEVVLVNAPHGDIVFCILTKNNEDQSWTPLNEAEELTRRIAKLIWNFYEPTYKW
jgi:beta-lactamase class A